MTALLAALRSRWTWAALGAVVAAGAVGFAAGRFSVPTRTTETTTASSSAQASTQAEHQAAAEVQYHDRTVTLWNSQAVIRADVNTRCEETFDPVSGRLARRVCETVDRSHTDSSAASSAAADVASTGSSSSSSSASTSSSTSSTTTTTKIVEAARPQWAAELGGRWAPTAMQLRPERLDVALGRRILGPVWLGATVDAPTAELGAIDQYRFGLRLRVEF